MPTSHDIALKIVATHDVDGQPRATSASTSHCVWKSTSSPPHFFGAVMRKTPARLSASNVSGSTRRACSVASALSRNCGTSAVARSRTVLDGVVTDGVIGTSRRRSGTGESVARRPRGAVSGRRQREGGDAGRILAATAAGDDATYWRPSTA